MNPNRRARGVKRNQSTDLHSVSAAGVIYDEAKDSFLVIRRRDNGELQLPGGILETRETIEEGLRREVLEETGLSVEPEALTGIYKNMVRGVVALVFRCRVIGGRASSTDEASEVFWLPRGEVESSMTPSFAVRLLDAIRRGSSPAVRHHDGNVLLDEPIGEDHRGPG